MMIRYISIILVLILCGCSDNKPDLAHLYPMDKMKQFNPGDDYIQPPIIIIPGVGGTTLINKQGEVVYPGSLTSILFHNHNDLALMIENDQLHSTNTQLMPGSIVSEVLGTDIYASLMNNLERYGHYRKARLGEKFTINERRYYLFPYDWRQSSYDNALKLSDFIDTIQNDYQDPSIEVDIIAHSYGGLISRYFLRYSNNKINDQGVKKVTQAGAKKVRRLIQLGTPNLGSVLSIHHFVNGLSMLNFEITIPSIVSIPSIYEILPHPSTNWAVDLDGNPLDIDLYDSNTWKKFKWAVYNDKVIQDIIHSADSAKIGRKHVKVYQDYFIRHLAAAKNNHLALTQPFKNVEYSIVAFGGNCTSTPARILFEPINGELKARFHPDDIINPRPDINYQYIMFEPGDGEVTKPSLLARNHLNPAIPRVAGVYFPIKYGFFLCHPHRDLAGDINFQDNLLNELLTR